MPIASEKTKNRLEWEKIIEKLTSHADTPLGKELCRSLEPSQDINEVKSGQTATSEAVGLLCRGAHAPLGGISDIRPFIVLAQRGGMLGTPALYNVRCSLEAGRKVRTFLLLEGKTSFFIEMGASMPLFPELQSELERCILGPDELADKASPVLFRLRREIVRLENQIREHLDGMVRSPTTQKYLQEPLVTMRDDRYVLPVKHEFRQQVPGVVHDQSASGATLFIEPFITFELGNRLREVRSQEEREVERILTNLSLQVAEKADQIESLLVQLGKLDFVLAKGKLALALQASPPRLSDDGYLELRQARNPLLDQAAVPVTIWLGRSFRTLVVTGPNTGGKTVLLKTIGLLVLMHQAGLHIPAQADSELPIFKQIFCDIGDEQSIEQSLSTFSAHMTNIISILQSCTCNSLVLLDELGAGTDPSEGAALGMAVLEYLGEVGATTVATTHYSELKVFAYSQPGVENASVEFDPITLQPTYRLVIGLPGRSNALEIAARLGLPKTIVEQARSFLCYADARADDLIRSLEEKRQHFEQLTAAADTAKVQAEKIHQESEARRQALIAREDALIRRAREDATRTVNYARRESERIIKELRRQTSRLMERERTLLAETARADLGKMQELIHDNLRLEEEVTQAEEVISVDRPLTAGQTIYIPHLKVKGSVIDPPDPEGNVRVQAGILKMILPARQIQVVSVPEGGEREPFVGPIASDKAQTISPELDLRGLTVDDAQYALGKYLDDARLAGLERVRLIHGKGTGVLRQAVQDYLKNHPDIRSYSLAGYREGGTGVTIALLKR